MTIPTVDNIFKTTARHFGMPPQVILDSSNRNREVTYARHIAMYISRLLTYKSFQTISKEIGYSNHASIIFGFKRIDCQMNGKTPPTFGAYRKYKSDAETREHTKGHVSAILKELK